MNHDAAVIAAARAWLAQDPDEATRAELDALIAGAESGNAESVAGCTPGSTRGSSSERQGCAANWRPARTG